MKKGLLNLLRGKGKSAALSATLTLMSLLMSDSILAQPLSVTLVADDIECGGFASGSILAVPDGGIPPYSFLWSNGSTNNPINTLPAGNYSVTVTDNIGDTTTASVTLTSPPPLEVVITQLTCSLPGAMIANVSGGVPPYMYMWSNGGNSPSITDLEIGEYCVTVMDANSCGFITCESVGPLLEVEVVTTPVICGTADGGTATAIVTGGVAPFDYVWSNGDSTEVIDSLIPGIYTVTVTAENDCTDTASGTVGVTPGDFLIDLDITQPTCTGFDDGSITASAFNGLAPYTYEWSNGESGASIFNLGPGTYSVTVTDALGCTDTESATLEYQSNLSIVLSGTNPTCADLMDGSITVTPSNGVPPYTYMWSTGETTQSINGLGEGTYSVTVNDEVGCEVTGSFTLNNPPEFLIDVTATDASNCGQNDGTVSASVVSGGTPPFDYLWSTGASTSFLTNIGAGTYSVTVTSSEGCTAEGSAIVGQPNLLLVDITGSNLVCGDDDDGTLTANVTYGTPPYSFMWSNGGTGQTISNLPSGTYSVTVTSVEGCTGSASATINDNPEIELTLDVQNLTCYANSSGQITANTTGGTAPITFLWSTGDDTPSISNLSIGTYSVTATDAVGCSASADATITQPDELTLEIEVMDGTCGMLGSATANVNGGTLPYTYQWSNGGSSSSILNLAAGSYSLTVTDANNCSTSTSFEIEVINAPSCEVVLIQPISTLNGNNGQLTAVVTGGNAPYTYLWSNGQTTQTAMNLSAGVYTVTVSDADDCETVCSFELLNPAKLGDFVWLDEDMDGIQDPLEPGFEGIVAILTGTSDYGDMVNASTSTDATGMYMFLVQPGSYKVTFNLPTNYFLTTNDVGADDAIDSDVNPVTNMTPFYTLAPGEINPTIDAGIFESPCENVVEPGTICCDQVLCGPGNIPDPLFETVPASGGVGALEYLWMFSTDPGPFSQGNYTPIPSATGPNYAPGPIYETTYFVRCVRREDCSMYLESNIITITVEDVAVAQINGPTSTCVDEPTDFSATPNDIGATFSWTFGGGIPATANTQDVPGVIWNSYGVKTITLMVENNGCSSFDTAQIFVSNSPILCGNALIINGEAMNESAISISWGYLASDTSGLTFEAEWSMDATNFSSIGGADLVAQDGLGWQFEKMHYSPEPGDNYYRIGVLDEFGQKMYSSVLKVEIETVSSVESLSLQGANVSPNPFDESIKIFTPNHSNHTMEFELFDAVGKMVLRRSLAIGTGHVHISTNHLRRGLYFGILRADDNAIRIFKMVK